MDGYNFAAPLHHDESALLTVFPATYRSDSVVFLVKQYQCRYPVEADCLLKAAFVQAHDPFPLWGALKKVIFKYIDPQRFSPDFTVNFIYEKFVRDPPRNFIECNDRIGSFAEGLNEYELRSLIYEREDIVSVHVAWAIRSECEVIVKMSGELGNIEKANGMIMEGIVQAHVAHKHNTTLIDIAIVGDEAKFKLCLVMEKLDKDVSSEVDERRLTNQPFAEEELLRFLQQVTAGLIQAKLKVKHTQRIAHRDIKPANIFIGSEGDYKVGDFGSAWVKGQVRGSRKRLQTVIERDFETMTISGAGTVQYLSPEMRQSLMGDIIGVDPFASDVYSLGVTVLELAKLETPKSLNTFDKAVLVKMVNEEVESLQYSESLREMIRAMLRIDPIQRPISEAINIEAGARLDGTNNHKLFEVHEMSSMELAVEETKQKGIIARLRSSGGENASEMILAGIELAWVYYQQRRLHHATELIQSLRLSIDLDCDHRFFSMYAFNLLTIISLEDSRYSEAVDWALKALSLSRLLVGEYNSTTVSAYSNLSSAYYKQSRYTEALEYGEQAFHINLTIFGQYSYPTANSCNTLSLLYQKIGKIAEYAAFAERSLHIALRLYGEHHKRTATSYHNIAICYFTMRRDLEAEQFFLRAAAIRQGYPGCRASLGKTFTNLSALYLRSGRLTEAVEYAHKGLSVALETCGETHINTGLAYSSLTDVYVSMKKIPEAVEFQEKAVEIFKMRLGECHPDTTTQVRILGKIYMDNGRLHEATEAMENSLHAHLQAYGQIHSNTADSYHILSIIYFEGKRLPEAKHATEMKLQIYLQLFGEHHEKSLEAYNSLSEVYFNMSKLPEAVTTKETCLRIALQIKGENDSTTIAIYNRLAMWYYSMRRFEESVKIGEKCVSSSLRVFGEFHLETGVAYFNVSRGYSQSGRLSEAYQFALKSLRIFKATLGDAHAQTIQTAQFVFDLAQYST